MKRLAKSLTLVLLFGACTAVADEQLVREFKGDQSTLTAAFTVESPWLLDWRLDSDYGQSTALDISLIDAQTGLHVGRVLQTKRRGNGLKLFEHSGRYKLRISSSLARWTVKIKQIAPEDAEKYSPKEEKKLSDAFINQ